jgi:hypothetical protein
MYSSTVWREFAQLLADLEASATPAAASARVSAFMAKYGASLYPNFVEATSAVACEDSDSPDSYAAWSAAGALADQTSTFGRAWTWTWSVCAQWSAFDEDRYTGPFDKPTANPLLVVNPRFDPATRYEGAVTVDELMPDSALLTVEGWGHTSLFMSQCADAAVERYLIEVATPSAGATCHQDVGPFDTRPAAASSSEARKRVQALSYINGRSPRARSAARRFPAQSRPSLADVASPAIDALGAQVAADRSGNAVYAWAAVEAATGISQVRTRTRSAQGRPGAVVALSDPGVEAFDVRVAANGRGAAVFSWLELDAASGMLALKTRSRSSRGVLRPVADVSKPGTDVGEHQIAISGTGEAVLTWAGLDRATRQLRARARWRSAAGALGAVVDLGDPALDSLQSRVAIDARGVATLVWTQGDQASGRTRVQTRTLSADGVLGPVADLGEDLRSTAQAKVAVGEDGDAVFAWLVFDEVSVPSVVQTRARSRSGTLGPVVELSEPADQAWDPVVAVDDDGDAVLAWWIAGRTGARVEARSRSARGTIGPRVTLSDDADDGYEPQVAVDDNGDAVLTWLAFDRDGVRVQGRSRSRHGEFGPRTDLSHRAEDAFSAQVAIGEQGDAVFGWSALNGRQYQVQGRSRSADGRLGRLAIISTTDRDAFEAQVSATAKRLQRIDDHR